MGVTFSYGCGYLVIFFFFKLDILDNVIATGLTGFFPAWRIMTRLLVYFLATGWAIVAMSLSPAA